MYEAVHLGRDGPSTASRVSMTAARYGYDGIVALGAPESSTVVDAGRIAEAYGVDVVHGIEIVTDDPSRASGLVGSRRDEADLLAVRGDSPAILRYAVRQDRVDVLTRPRLGPDGLDPGLARAAADHGVRVAVDLGPVLRSTGGRRVRAIDRLGRLRDLLLAYDVPFVVTGGPDSHLTLRGPRELAALGGLLGFDEAGMEHGLDEWGRIAAANRERRSADYAAPGVKRGRYDG